MALESTLEYSNQQINWLIEQYRLYADLEKQIKEMGSHPPKGFKINLSIKSPIKSVNPADHLKKQQRDVGIGMKFQNPYIWAMYKFLAYKDDPVKNLQTLSDLKAHCKIDGICSKRFAFINSWLRTKNNGTDFHTGIANDEDGIDRIASSDAFTALLLDEDFMTEWSSHENNPKGKWFAYKV